MFMFNRRHFRHMRRFSAHRMEVLNCFGKFEELFRLLLSECPDTDTIRSVQIALDNCERAADGELSHLLDPPPNLPSSQIFVRLIPLSCTLDQIAKACRKTAHEVMREAPDFPDCLRAELSEILALTKKQLSLLCRACELMTHEAYALCRDRRPLTDIRIEAEKIETLRTDLHDRIFVSAIALSDKCYHRDLLDRVCAPSDMIGEAVRQIELTLLRMRR